MKLERIQVYKNELASRSTKDWGEILFRMASEAMTTSSDSEKEFHYLRREIEILKMKLSLAIPVLCTYSEEAGYAGGRSTAEMALAAKVTLDKIQKVDWLVSGSTQLETDTMPHPSA